MGFYDGQDIWIYTEDDPASPFADTLNLGMESVSDAIADDRARLAALESQGGTATYTPILLNVTLGNGTLVGRWGRLGDLVYWHFNLTLGSTTTIDNVFGISLPVAGDAAMLVFGNGYVGRGTSAVNRTLCQLRSQSGFIRMWYAGGNVASASPLAGGTWQAGDTLAGSGVYLAA